ncbi:hypothetical protein [Mariniphaga sp.]|uniref:hypothetical protein n=1 Tax=Mariniphaga sp. TaxID=1954475 RepID=UPI00356706FE
MKTNTTKWIAVLITIITVTSAINSAFAQRRSTQNNKTETRVEQKRETRNNTTHEKSAVKTSNVEQENKKSDLQKRRSTNTSKKTGVQNKRNETKTQRVSTPTRAQQSKPEVRQNLPASRNATKAAKVNDRNTPARRSTSSKVNSNSGREARSSIERNSAKNLREKNSGNRNIYRLDEKDSRYTPNKDYRGNNKSWTTSYAKHHVPYSLRNNNFYKHYDHRKYKHWDRSWEKYHWNLTSWRDYYSGYHPQSYQFHKYYYYHPRFGHVIKKFKYRPVHFVHNNVRYYNFNGHFFTYFKGVGYVLVDMPYLVVFQNLPTGYERVYINGFHYFRIGNLFFEMHPHGYSLVHYPERYFALEIGFRNNEYYPNNFYY